MECLLLSKLQLFVPPRQNKHEVTIKVLLLRGGEDVDRCGVSEQGLAVRGSLRADPDFWIQDCASTRYHSYKH